MDIIYPLSLKKTFHLYDIFVLEHVPSLIQKGYVSYVTKNIDFMS